MKRTALLLFGWLVALAPVAAGAQGIIIPPDRWPIVGSYSVKSVTIDATVKDQVAQVQLTQVFKNTGSRDMEVTYLFPVPQDGVVSQFTLLIDGREHSAKLYPKEEARRIYEEIVRTKRDPALLEYMGYGALRTSVFPLPAGGERQVTLRYTQLCRRDRDLTELMVPLSAGKLSAKPIEELKIAVRLADVQRIKSVYSPTHGVEVQRPSDYSAVARLAQTHVTPADDFRLLWNLSEQPIGATLLSYRPSGAEDGYFLLLAAPEVKAEDAKAAAKTVIFVLDRSGSMTGQKIEQAKNALRFVLNNLREGDTFNIVVYDDRVESFKPELQRFETGTRTEALRFVDNIFAGGSTNIDGALKRAMELVSDASRPSYIIFLTDGLPTTGETREAQIAANCKAGNRGKVRLFAFGVGYDVNARLLDRLSGENFGTSEYVRPNEDVEASVSKFYAKMTAPVLADLKIELAGTDTNRTYPRDLPDLFAGGQLIWVGRYRTSGDVRARLTGKVGGAERSFEFPAQLAASSSDQTYSFVEKLWAVRRVGAIIDELDLKGQNKELVDELVMLSTKHGILTPYTAFLADERTQLHARADNTARAERETMAQLGEVAGLPAVNLRLGKGGFQRSAQAPKGGVQRFFDAAGKETEVVNCQVVGDKALFRRANRWVDPSVTPEDEKRAEVVEQFSDKFFELARNNADLRKFLALSEGCTVRVGGNVYQINRAAGQ